MGSTRNGPDHALPTSMITVKPFDAAELGIDLTVDPDDLHIGDGYDALALYLNAAMICDDAAQARYAEIYGRTWEPVPPPAEGPPRRSARVGVGTTTIVGSARARVTR